MTQGVTNNKTLVAFVIFVAVASFSAPFFAVAQQAGTCEPPNTPVTCPSGRQTCQIYGAPNACDGIDALTPEELSKTSGKIAESFLNLTVGPALQAVSYFIVALVGLLFGIAGLFLDKVLDVTVVNMARTIGDIEAISFLWKMFRDVANIGFIFLMLYISIGTILRIDKYNVKQMLVRIVIAALLINFSLFFTRVIIDASNILTNEFYQPVKTLALGAQSGSGGSSNITIVGFAARFAQLTKIGSVFNANTSVFDKITSLFSVRMAVTQFAAALFILIATFVFIAIGLLFLIRLIVFLILMATAPIGFVAGLLPSLKQLADKWWGALWDQVLFAPAFMLLAFVAFVFMDSIQKTLIGTADYSFSAILSGNKPDSIVIIINFAIAAGLLITALIIAKTLASKSAGGLVKWATGKAGALSFGVAGWAGRQTLGRAGLAVADSKQLQYLAQKGPAGTRWIGKGLLYGGEKFKKSSMDLRGGPMKDLGAGQPQKGGFEKMVKDRTKIIKKRTEGTEEYEAQTLARREEAQQRPDKINSIRRELELANKEMEEMRARGEFGTLAYNAKRDELGGMLRRLQEAETGIVESIEKLRKNLSDVAEKLSPEEILRSKEAQGEIDKIEKDKNKPREKKDEEIRAVRTRLESRFTAPGQQARVRNYMDAYYAVKEREKREGDIGKALKSGEGEKMVSSWQVARREAGKELRKDPSLREKVKKFAKELGETDADLIKGEEEGEEKGGEKPAGGEPVAGEGGEKKTA